MFFKQEVPAIIKPSTSDAVGDVIIWIEIAMANNCTMPTQKAGFFDQTML